MTVSETQAHSSKYTYKHGAHDPETRRQACSPSDGERAVVVEAIQVVILPLQDTLSTRSTIRIDLLYLALAEEEVLPTQDHPAGAADQSWLLQGSSQADE